MEQFLICGQLVWMVWERVEALPHRAKTSLALTRQRARRAMELSLIQPVRSDLYMRGLVRFW